MDSGDALLASGDDAIRRRSLSAHSGARTCSYMSRSRLKCVGKRMSNKPGRTKSVEHATADPRTYTCTTGTFTPGIPSGRELKSERSNQCRGKWVRSLSTRLVIRVGTYSGVERFGEKERWLYIEGTDGDFKNEWRW